MGFATFFLLLVGSCTLLDVPVMYDSRIMSKWFGCCAVSLLFTLFPTFGLVQQRVHIRMADVAIIIFLFYLLCSDYCWGNLSEPIVLRLVSLALLYYIFRQSIGEYALDICFAILLLIGVVVSVWGIAQFVLAILHNQPLHTAVVGCFDNPAGFALTLSLAFPAGLHLLVPTTKYRRLRYCIYVALSIILLGILLSCSRTGWLAILCVGIYAYSTSVKRRGRLIMLGLLVLGLMFAAFYFIRQDSADGRSYIALCTWHQIADAPWWGHGRNGFAAGYMDYQAAYLDAHPDSRFTWLADNTHHPFNEWLYLAVRYGGIGVLLAIFVLLSLTPTVQPQRKSGYSVAIGILIALFPFSLFSYPMQYPLAWVMLIMAFGLLVQHTKSVSSWTGSRVIPLCALLCACSTAPLFYRTIRAEVEWYDVATRSLAGQTRYVLPRYEALYRHLKHSPHFLYNYAAELNYIGEYHRSQEILNKCVKQLDDYDTHLLAASNHEHMGNYGLTELYLRKAAAMCPIRFVPLYKLAKFYGAMGRYGDQRRVAQQIMGKKVKIPSQRITDIKDEMRYILEETDFK